MLDSLQQTLKYFKIHSVYSGILQQQNLYILYMLWVGLQSSSLSQSSHICLSFSNHSQRLFQKRMEGFDCKVTDQTLWATLWQRLGGLDRQEQMQSVEVPAGQRWQRLACFRKTCYHSCDTNLVQEKKKFSICCESSVEGCEI